MNEIGTTLKNDAVLAPYLRALDEADASAALEELVCERAQPVVRNVIQGKLRVGHSSGSDLTNDEAADLAGEVTLKLVRRLRELRSNLAPGAIENFRGYVAVMAYHACDGYLRKKYPLRHSLKNQLRYLLTYHKDFAVWEGAGGVLLCGLARWQNRKKTAHQSKLREFVEHPELSDQLAKKAGEKSSPPDLLATIFKHAREPVEFEALVALVADLWQVKDLLSHSYSSDADSLAAAPVASSDQLATEMDQRTHLENLWAEIRELPMRQRWALLMSLRDSNGRGVLALLPLIGVASISQIAAALAVPAEKLAGLWNELPLADKAIAESLGITRQQVINLRKCARERLWRRTRGL